MPILIRGLFLLASLYVVSPAFALNLSMPVDRYAEAMEFYYQNPRPELISPMLRAFSEKGILANAEKRLFVAAFLAELIRKNDLGLLGLVADARKLNQDAITTAAWTARLSGHGGSLLTSLLEQCNAVARRQIESSPARLSDWKPEWENSVINMYWGAFMATGNPQWLDAIINAALAWAKSGRHPTGQYAAATLYDYAPGHELVEKRLRQRLQGADPAETRMLNTVLEHVEKVRDSRKK